MYNREPLHGNEQDDGVAERHADTEEPDKKGKGARNRDEEQRASCSLLAQQIGEPQGEKRSTCSGSQASCDEELLASGTLRGENHQKIAQGGDASGDRASRRRAFERESTAGTLPPIRCWAPRI